LKSIVIEDGKPVSGHYDFYDVANSFGMLNEQIKHAAKKMLQTGGRSGGKSVERDIKDCIWSLQEALKEVSSLDPNKGVEPNKDSTPHTPLQSNYHAIADYNENMVTELETFFLYRGVEHRIIYTKDILARVQQLRKHPK
jgi:hypothetical protein